MGLLVGKSLSLHSISDDFILFNLETADNGPEQRLLFPAPIYLPTCPVTYKVSEESPVRVLHNGVAMAGLIVQTTWKRGNWRDGRRQEGPGVLVHWGTLQGWKSGAWALSVSNPISQSLVTQWKCLGFSELPFPHLNYTGLPRKSFPALKFNDWIFVQKNQITVFCFYWLPTHWGILECLLISFPLFLRL